MPIHLAKQIREIVPGTFLNMYGPTETTIWSSTCALDDVGDLVPLGTPIANTQFHILNPEGNECPAYVAGELHIGGDGVCPGYWERDELTAERFVPDPFDDQSPARFYRTGDLARRHADGTLEFLGRIDHQVKIRGHRIELGEIEVSLGQQPGVKDAVAVAREDVEGDLRIVGYVTPADSAALDAKNIILSLGQTLPEVMVPSNIVILSDFPLTPNGKIDRKALPSPRAESAAPKSLPGNETEDTVAAIWCELLGLPAVGTTDNFFDLGGHSLLVVQVQRRLTEALGIEISITDMFRFSTIQSLAEHIVGGPVKETAVDRGIGRAAARRARMRRRQTVLASVPD